MVNTHEITLSESDYSMLNQGSYLVLNASDVEVKDYVLFYKDGDDSANVMTRINQIIQHDGFKDGYALYIFTRLG